MECHDGWRHLLRIVRARLPSPMHQHTFTHTHTHTQKGAGIPWDGVERNQPVRLSHACRCTRRPRWGLMYHYPLRPGHPPVGYGIWAVVVDATDVVLFLLRFPKNDGSQIVLD